MTRRATWSRLAALLCAGALAVHELRYLLAFGAGSGRALAHDGHAYLGAINPLVAVLVAGVLAQLMRLGARGGAQAGARPAATFGRWWIEVSAALVFIYAVQELVEGQLAAGHAAGLAALGGNGGLLAVPVALAIGAIVALFVREAPGVAGRVRADVAARCIVVSPARELAAPAAPARLRMLLLARHLAGRAPPLVFA